MGQRAQTHRIVSNKKPDIIIRDNIEGTCMSIDGAIPTDRNVINDEAEIILKYNNLTIEIYRMWNVKAKMVPIRTGET
jgi:hypothetical protein